jgi:filamentous hemagglutinin
VSLRAAQVDATGALAIAAIQGGVGIEAGQSGQSLVEAHQFKGRGFLSKQTNTFGRQHDSTQAQASEVGGQSVSIASGQDVRITGSSVIADQDLSINAARNVTLEAAQNTSSTIEFNETKKSGLFSSGGGITLGKQQQSTTQQGQGTGSAASTVGAIAGDVSITAGRAYAQTGSDVLSPGGDITVAAQSVQITEARETIRTTTEQKFKQSGVTLAISSPVLSANRQTGLARAVGHRKSGSEARRRRQGAYRYQWHLQRTRGRWRVRQPAQDRRWPAIRHPLPRGQQHHLGAHGRGLPELPGERLNRPEQLDHSSA